MINSIIRNVMALITFCLYLSLRRKVNLHTVEEEKREGGKYGGAANSV